jgi:hypothetical protein
MYKIHFFILLFTLFAPKIEVEYTIMVLCTKTALHSNHIIHKYTYTYTRYPVTVCTLFLICTLYIIYVYMYVKITIFFTICHNMNVHILCYYVCRSCTLVLHHIYVCMIAASSLYVIDVQHQITYELFMYTVYKYIQSTHTWTRDKHSNRDVTVVHNSSAVCNPICMLYIWCV